MPPAGVSALLWVKEAAMDAVASLIFWAPLGIGVVLGTAAGYVADRRRSAQEEQLLKRESRDRDLAVLRYYSEVGESA